MHTFDSWRRALRSASTALVPVVVAQEVAQFVVDAVIEVMLSNGIRLRVPHGSEAQVGAIVSALRAC